MYCKKYENDKLTAIFFEMLYFPPKKLKVWSFLSEVTKGVVAIRVKGDPTVCEHDVGFQVY